MDSIDHEIPNARQPGRAANVSRRGLVAEMTACLALVRPVGMSADEAEDWLAVAAQSLQHLPQRILSLACVEARRTCTHHAQIVPAIIAAAEPELERERRISEYGYVPVARQIAPPQRREMTQADVDRLPAYLVNLGLTAGHLVRDDRGHVVLASQ